MHPRTPILQGPTPLMPLPRLSEHLGIDLWIKRDDLAGPSLGGNKARQLEYYLGAAEAEGADTILITGAVQSNFVRTAAALANSRGLRTVAQLEDRVPGRGDDYHRSGNVLLLEMLGAEILSYPEGEDEAGADAALQAHAETLRARGARPYVIPLGEAHPPLGALGYLRGGQELIAQDAAWDLIVAPSGSGATHAGLLAGVRGAGSAAPVIGSCVRRSADLQGPRIARILERLAALTPDARSVAPEDIALWDGALAPGYGRIGPPARAAMALMARQEGLFLDPVYTAKSFAAIPGLLAEGRIRPGARVCFLHTGGLAALFGYQSELSDLFGPKAAPTIDPDESLLQKP